LGLTEREIQLVAYSAVRGSISYKAVRDEFIRRYNSSSPTINNMVPRLKKLKLLVKHGKYIIVNPVIALDFSKPLILQITLTMNNERTRETNEHATEGVLDKEAELKA
jgi:hypothetical protein